MGLHNDRLVGGIRLWCYLIRFDAGMMVQTYKWSEEKEEAPAFQGRSF
jgi:hypothetical protein